MIKKINCKSATLRQMPDGSCQIEYEVYEPEASKKPREFWIDPHAEYYHRTKVGGHYIHVTEILPGYKLINIDKLLQTLCYSGITGSAADNFINEIGFSNE